MKKNNSKQSTIEVCRKNKIISRNDNEKERERERERKRERESATTRRNTQSNTLKRKRVSERKKTMQQNHTITHQITADWPVSFADPTIIIFTTWFRLQKQSGSIADVCHSGQVPTPSQCMPNDRKSVSQRKNVNTPHSNPRNINTRTHLGQSTSFSSSILGIAYFVPSGILILGRSLAMY